MKLSLLALVTLSIVASCTGPDEATPGPGGTVVSASAQEPTCLVHCLILPVPSRAANREGRRRLTSGRQKPVTQ